MNYAHVCSGCAHKWIDIHRYHNCPWCGGAVSNELIEDEIPFVTDF